MAIKTVFAVTMVWMVVACALSSMITNNAQCSDTQKCHKAHSMALYSAIGSGLLAALSLAAMIFI